MKKWFVFLFAAMFSVSLFAAGCNSGSKEDKGKDAAQTESADKAGDAKAEKADDAAEAAGGEAKDESAEPAVKEEADGSESTLEALCEKVIKESQAIAGGVALDKATLDQARGNCMMADDAYESMPNGKAAIGAMVDHYMTKCGDKAAQEFMDCYIGESMAAGEAAMKAMQQ